MITNAEVGCYGLMFEAHDTISDDFLRLAKDFNGIWGVHINVPFVTVVFSTKGKADDFLKNPVVKHLKVYQRGEVLIPYEEFLALVEWMQKKEGREEYV